MTESCQRDVMLVLGRPTFDLASARPPVPSSDSSSLMVCSRQGQTQSADGLSGSLPPPDGDGPYAAFVSTLGER